MKQSRKSTRMNRHYRRMHKTSGLNLVSLMDIFTILVFFLMVNSGDVKVLQQDKSIQLPESVADQLPAETLVLTLSENDVLVQGWRVASIEEVKAGGEIIDPLKIELERQRARNTLLPPGQSAPITLVGGKDLPYSVLKKIMSTCVDAGYTDISLAVMKKAAKEA